MYTATPMINPNKKTIFSSHGYLFFLVYKLLKRINKVGCFKINVSNGFSNKHWFRMRFQCRIDAQNVLNYKIALKVKFISIHVSAKNYFTVHRIIVKEENT